MKHICIDLDGVLADLERGLYEEFRVTKEDLKDRGFLFGHILPEYVKAKGFANQGQMPEARALVDFILKQKEIKISILTSAGHFFKPISEVVHQKKVWVETNFPELSQVPFIATTSGKDKAIFANPSTLLIDDHVKNIEAFREADGVAIHYELGSTSLEEVFKQILDFLY